ncbi:aminoacyl-tRNA hydrolase [Pseudoglutamicibacter cumminsii]|uniref:aminoacyl-tRNA hydrolase n=1 Tax=Pseudoglutamicibacter cumminsii TaxID=156979 RepID=UPI00195BC9BC|nr:aminoacyl-tRNA hydrolase [Pseudoglutamicibacter cumminsii]MBM7796389.1 PTH1 family peptidyl-tRNA hydrolase [Pseudoglutamicibacter cumminsii]
MASDTYLIAGLGNTGARYAKNRHNIGFMVADELAGRIGGTFKASSAHRSMLLEGRLGIGGPRVALIKPTTLMNRVGGAVSSVAKYFGIPDSNVIAIHDEIELDFDTTQSRLGGTEAGHNGLRDITKALGTRDYWRVRVGVGRPPGRQQVADYVLSDFSAQERKTLPMTISDAADEVEKLMSSL